jgi:anaerobic ribonucleoside-triphosphate reductase activating protein
MNYAEIKNVDIANGPGVRISLFVSGCPHHCKGCFNEVTWDFTYGKPYTQETINHILELLKPDYIKGITFLGGEPMTPSNQEAVLNTMRQIKEHYTNKDIWLYTGYLLDTDIMGKMVDTLPHTSEILSYIDVLVDGPFIEEQKNLNLQFKGSENQRIIDMKKTLSSGSIVLWSED